MTRNTYRTIPEMLVKIEADLVNIKTKMNYSDTNEVVFLGEFEPITKTDARAGPCIIKVDINNKMIA